MGWNDHVSFDYMRCKKCGEVRQWENWDEIAMQRYSGSLGQKLGHDVNDANKCPHCGHTEGEWADPDEDELLYGEDDDEW
jgi:hypothetical protein